MKLLNQFFFTVIFISLTYAQSLDDRAKLIPIIPPSRGHGFDLYGELGTDKILIYTRFDDSSPDFPTTTNWSSCIICCFLLYKVKHSFLKEQTNNSAVTYTEWNYVNI